MENEPKFTRTMPTEPRPFWDEGMTEIRLEIITYTGTNPDGSPQGTKTGHQIRVSKQQLEQYTQTQDMAHTLEEIINRMARPVTQEHDRQTRHRA